MAKLFDLSGKVAIVTGGNGGIGLGMATGLAEVGATIVIAARDAEKNASAVAALRTSGIQASSRTLNVTDEAACKLLIQLVSAQYGNGLCIFFGIARCDHDGRPRFCQSGRHAQTDSAVTAGQIGRASCRERV